MSGSHHCFLAGFQRLLQRPWRLYLAAELGKPHYVNNIFDMHLRECDVLLANDVCLEVSARAVVISVNLKMSPFDTVPNMSVLVDEPTLTGAKS